MDITLICKVYKHITYIPLGDSCAIAYNIDRLKLRTLAFPFDWVKIKLKDLIQILENKFKDFDKIEIVKISEAHRDLEEFSRPTYIITNPYNITMAHEVLSCDSLDDFKVKLTRRIDRFYDNLQNKIKFVRLETSPYKQCYNDYLNKLINILDNICSDYQLILIVHKSYQDKIINYEDKLKLIFFDDFNPDWRYENIDWTKIKDILM